VTTMGLYACLGLWSLETVGISGDEPHYLIVTQSVLVDRDFRPQWVPGGQPHR